MNLGSPSRIVMKWDTPEECMEVIKTIYPNAEVVRAEKPEEEI